LKPIATLRASELELNKPVRVHYPPFDIAVARTESGIYAIEDACNHAGASLSGGPVEDECILCPLHGYVFRLCDGELPLRAAARL
jgi:nitrite reductase (NADH) small subunit